MASINKVMFLGNLTRDPELTYTATQTPVCKFGIAMNHKWGKGADQKEKVCFVDVTLFGKQAEATHKYMFKGSSVFVEGRLDFDSWDKRDGSGKAYKHSVMAEKVTFMGQPRGAQAPTPAPNTTSGVPDKEIPF